ncbi:MAG: hypothetical protein DWQ08_11240 [Proteobacteria bacterium]|nr:MAG: hypothetical protein DWQ08_11240 [Pseudomonadota bacterium]
MEVLFSAATLISDPSLLIMLFLGVIVGLFFGVLPGLSGLSALAVLLPFTFMFGDALPAIGFLLGAHAAVYAGGSVTSIVLGIPGSPANAATVKEGHAMFLRGDGGEAVGAALFASMCGGIVGAAVLVSLIPLLGPVVLSFAAPEIFLVALLGIVWASVFSQGPLLATLAAAALGLLMSSFGYQRSTGVPRFWFDFDYLLDGMRLVPLVLGLFAVPEIVQLMQDRGTRMAGDFRIEWRALARGVAAVCNRPLLFLRSTLIGVLVGIVPGVGGETAPFVAHAASRPDRRTRAEVDGVIAPESSNNAKEGGSLVPTLALGIPGSASMAILLGAFMVFGLEPGPDFLSSHLDMVVGLGWILVFSNVVASILMVPLTFGLVRCIRLPGNRLAPILVVLVVAGAYLSSKSLVDVVFVFAFGLLGLAMVRYEYSRPLLVLGFILGPIIETYLHISIRAYGVELFARPVAVVFMVLIVVAPFARLKRRRRTSQ